MITITLAVEINILNKSLEASLGQALHYAVQIGQKLNEAKDSLPHGEFGAWLDENCTVKERQAQNYMRLARENPNFLNTQSSAYLGIDAAMALLSAPDAVQEEVTQRLEMGESITHREIQELKRANAELEAAKAAAEKASEWSASERENWRQQYLDERNSKRDLQTELINVKASKKETIYIDDSSKALAQLKEETTGKIEKLKAELADTRETMAAKVNESVAERLANHADELDRLQGQEAALRGKIELLQKQENDLHNSVGKKHDQLEAIKEYRARLESLVFSANILFDSEPDQDDKTAWLKLFSDTRGMCSTFENILNESAGEVAL